MENHYQTLGIDSTATADQIKQAYRKLAMQHHPDRGGDAAAFQKIQQAYSVLSDPAQHQQYDQPRSQAHAGTSSSPFNFDTIFEIFGADLRRQQRMPPRIALWLTLSDVITGGSCTVNLQIDQTVETVQIAIPSGIQDNDHVRYPGIAPGGQDLIVNFRIKPDAVWQRDGQHLIRLYSIDMWELILGCQISIVDPAGNQLLLTVPAETQTGTVLRLKNKGLPGRPRSAQQPDAVLAGDLLVRLEAKIQYPVDPTVLAALQSTKKQ